MVSWGDLRREPFRLFFPLGVAFGCLGVGHWLMYAFGWMASYSGFYHASLQVGAYMSCFIVGFLLTALPRFSATAPASDLELAAALGLVAFHVMGLWLKWWIVAEACFAGLLLLIAVFAGRRFARRASAVGPPTEFVWIPMALLLGLCGTGMVMFGQAALAPRWLIGVGQLMASQGFLLGIVLGVGGFMAPRLMGREVLLVTPVGLTPEQARRIRLRRTSLHGLAGMFFFASFWIEGDGITDLAYLLRASIVSAELAWTAQFYRLPKVRVGYVKLLWVSIWMVVLGLWLAGLVPRYRVAMLHVTFLGGFSLMMFAVGTMVILSHTGQSQRLCGPLWVLRVVGLGVACAIVARLVAEWQEGLFFQWLGVAAVFWLVAGVGWLSFALPILSRPVSQGAFERMHEEAKRRLLEGSAAGSVG